MHGQGKLLMGNTLFEDVPWAGRAFDYLGVEVNWLQGGNFVPDDDARLSYRRTLAGQRPYGLLMNTDFRALAAAAGRQGRSSATSRSPCSTASIPASSAPTPPTRPTGKIRRR